jgi:hypothetical protein
MKQIKETIAKVRSDRTARARTEAAEHLARLAKKSAAKKSRRRS